MEIKRIVYDTGCSLVSKVDRFITSKKRRSRRIDRDISEFGEKEALRRMRRKTIRACIFENSDLLGQDMAVFCYLSNIYDNHKKVRIEYNRYRETKRRLLSQYNINVRK